MHKMVRDYAEKHDIPVVYRDGWYVIKEQGFVNTADSCATAMRLCKRYRLWRDKQVRLAREIEAAL